jgi:hypothetical protein
MEPPLFEREIERVQYSLWLLLLMIVTMMKSHTEELYRPKRLVSVHVFVSGSNL